MFQEIGLFHPNNQIHGHIIIWAYGFTVFPYNFNICTIGSHDPSFIFEIANLCFPLFSLLAWLEVNQFLNHLEEFVLFC